MVILCFILWPHSGWSQPGFVGSGRTWQTADHFLKESLRQPSRVGWLFYFRMKSLMSRSQRWPCWTHVHLRPRWMKWKPWLAACCALWVGNRSAKYNWKIIWHLCLGVLSCCVLARSIILLWRPRCVCGGDVCTCTYSTRVCSRQNNGVNYELLGSVTEEWIDNQICAGLSEDCRERSEVGPQIDILILESADVWVAATRDGEKKNS